ncbi:MAG: M23 family metallopeptidase [Lawsonibacter sp.]|nr:M23 family metallopeptidase [Lawsonibacter sp.]
MDEALHRRRAAPPQPADLTPEERRQKLLRDAGALLRGLRHWTYIHSRRLAHGIHDMSTDHPSAGPISFLTLSFALGAALTLSTLYTSSYTVTADGQALGVVADQGVVASAIAQVERRGSQLLGYDYHVDSSVDYQFALTLKSELDSQETIETYFYERLDELSAQLRKYQLSLNGAVLGAADNRDGLQTMLDSLKEQYVNENTISAEFVDDLRIETVYTDQGLMTLDQLRELLTASKSGETTYTVVKGDTYNGIAYAHDMALSDLLALNPDADVNRLMIGDVLTIKQEVPLLSVETVEDVTYTQAIECPVTEVEDPNMYRGNSKILVQGEPGEAEINAHVTYVNGIESGREILSTTTLREPTVTTKAIGTKERPKTASTGTFSWPIYGRINSYFGGRYIFGSYSYHSGIDIRASYGAPIAAADGGTVTFSGWKGSYGNLVIITHDNGIQTYYAHNSSLKVSVGQKVYKGQTIALAGSTGRSTGTHCHFGVCINGTFVNPLSYLS